ncbi:MAG TPA: OmpA family protein [Salegentibacter sp.]|uniref:OmpA family protein n=1 Tax=Salegentibacter sp. TaxID=1903072 RepID=UPI002F952B7C
MKTNYYLILVLLLAGFSLQAQKGKQKKADRLYNDLAYFEAVEVYKELIENDYNTIDNKQKLADSYLQLRSPENAVFYYEDIIDEPDISPEYYYKYAQALRAVKRYDESREWVKKYLASNGKSRAAQNMLEEKEKGINTTYTLEEAAFNSEFSDFGAFERGGKMYIVSARAEGVPVKKRVYSWTGEPFLNIYEVNPETNEVMAVGGDVNTKLHDGPAVISPDGNTMYFTRNNYFNNREGKRDKNATNHLKIYKASLSGNSWRNVTELAINHNEYSVGHPALSPDGNTLYFTSDMPGGFGGTDIYKVEIKGESLGEPENLGQNINTEQDESFPFVDEEGMLYFSSNGHGGFGFFDIFRVNLDNSNPEVKNLGEPVNSNLDDFAFFKSSEQNTGYISSNREGNDNIYGFNQLNPLVLKGKVTDAINDKPIGSATIRIFDENEEQIAFLTTDEDGNYRSEVARNKELPLEAKQIEYKEFTTTINTRNSDELEEIEYNISLQPVKDVEYLAEIDNIYFDFDKSNIRKDAALELDKLVELMKNKYPDLVIEIGAHTDLRGSEQYNEKLAERRAQSTRQYLIDNGIDKKRIYAAKGYGEREPAIDCERCTREEHQLNRRSMFKVVKMN